MSDAQMKVDLVPQPLTAMPNVKAVVLQPNLRMADGTIREVAPLEVNVRVFHMVEAPTVIILGFCLVWAGYLSGRGRRL